MRLYSSQQGYYLRMYIFFAKTVSDFQMRSFHHITSVEKRMKNQKRREREGKKLASESFLWKVLLLLLSLTFSLLSPVQFKIKRDLDWLICNLYFHFPLFFFSLSLSVTFHLVAGSMMIMSFLQFSSKNMAISLKLTASATAAETASGSYLFPSYTNIKAQHGKKLFSFLWQNTRKIFVLWLGNPYHFLFHFLISTFYHCYYYHTTHSLFISPSYTLTFQEKKFASF